MQMPSTIVILGTGGTIAGTAANPLDNVGYRSAQRTVAELLAAIPALTAMPAVVIESEQVAQIDSKDMDHATWQALARRCAWHLARPEVQGVIVAHGTDTLEETAWFLHRVLAPTKPLILTGAMRPATSLGADGPQNLMDAVSVVREPGAHGTVVVFAGMVHSAVDVRKSHSHRLDPFDSGDGGPLGCVEGERLRRFREWPLGVPLGLSVVDIDLDDWPWVAVLNSHAGAKGESVKALLAYKVRGLVVAGTGNGTVHQSLEEALLLAERAGVPVWRCTRCAKGLVVQPQGESHVASSVIVHPGTQWQARIDLMLKLLSERFS